MYNSAYFLLTDFFGGSGENTPAVHRDIKSPNMKNKGYLGYLYPAVHHDIKSSIMKNKGYLGYLYLSLRISHWNLYLLLACAMVNCKVVWTLYVNSCWMKAYVI